MKSTWRLACQTESDWTVISNEGEVDEPAPEARQSLDEDCTKAAQLFADVASTEPAGEKKPVWFNESYRISTYLYAIVAGPFGYHER